MRLVDLKLDEATISIEMRDDLRQPSGVLHGGVTATLIDTAMAFAVRTRLEPTASTATIDLTVHYLRPWSRVMPRAQQKSFVRENEFSPLPPMSKTRKAN